MSKKTVEDLFKNALADGAITGAGRAAIELVDPGAQIQAALGVSVDDVPASEVVLVTLMPDDSGSIAAARADGAVADGHNLVLDALGSSRQRAAVLTHTRYLNGKILHPYCTIDRAQRMSRANYCPDQGTPLYDQSVVLLSTVIVKAQEMADAGVAARTVTLIITDGEDQHSTRARAADVRALVEDMRRAESHVIAAMGVGGSPGTFRKVFREMGIEDRFILTPSAAGSEIRRAFQVFSQSAARVSQGVAPSVLGGFTN
jgi:hypothetical protein